MKKVSRHEPGARVFAPKDFFTLGERGAVYKALSRLVEDGRLRRVGRGLYDRPATSLLVEGVIPASIDAVLDALRRSKNVRIIPDHAAAANALGLTTALPVRPTFVANRELSDIRLGRRTVRFRQAESVLEPWLDSAAAPIVQSLLWLRSGGFSLDGAAEKIRGRASERAKRALAGGIEKLPAWMWPVAHEIVRHRAAH